MSRWTDNHDIGLWRHTAFIIPATSYEAAIFLNDAIYHLRNRGVSWIAEEIDILADAAREVGREI